MNISSLKNTRLAYLCLPLLALANGAYLTHNVFGWIFTLAFFLYAPGYLFLKRLVTTDVLGVGRISLSIGVSLSLLTITGLVLDCLHFIGLERPMETINIFAALDILVLVMLLINASAIVQLRMPRTRLKKEEIFFCIVATVLPVLAALGAFRLNNGASNILTMILIGMIGILYITLALRPNMNRIYPYIVFMTGLSILFCISLRGWSITGHDIHHEFNVFNSVLQKGYWSPGTDPGDPYNACLSITVLPTIFAKITHIDPIYVYKLLYQIIFAAIVPALYLFARKLTTDKRALIGIFAFMAFPTFTNDLPFLNRQEMAFGYFILLLFVNFSNITYRAKSALTVLLLLTIILSHYSTSYVSVSVLLLTFVIFKVLSRLYKKPERLIMPILSLPVIITAILATFLWNVQITASSSNLSSTLTSTINGILGKNKESSQFSGYGLLTNKRSLTPAEQLAQKANNVNAQVTYVPTYTLPLTKLGDKLSKVINVNSFSTSLHALIAKVLQLLVVIGTFILAIYCRRKTVTSRDIYLLSIGMSFLIALVLFTFFPQLSVGYDVTRLFQQSMMVLWLPVILALGAIFSWMGKYSLVASSALLVFIYLNLSGFIPQLTGGFLPPLSLNNSGVYYDFFYTQRSDFTGAKWLAANRLNYMNVFLDSNAASPPLKYPVALGLINGKSQGYYFVDHWNAVTGRSRTILPSGFAEYTNPAFTADKSLVYTNGNGGIYLKLSPPN